MDINANECQPVSLEDLGWDSFFENYYRMMQIPGVVPARVISGSRGSFRIYCQHGELSAGVSGKMHYSDGEENQYPTVGDWVAVTPLVKEGKGVIYALLPRKSKFSRKAAGERTDEQVVSANVDTVFIVSGLDGGRSFNLRRMERYLTLAWSSGATPVMVLNKADLCQDIDAHISAVGWS